MNRTHGAAVCSGQAARTPWGIYSQLAQGVGRWMTLTWFPAHWATSCPVPYLNIGVRVPAPFAVTR
jgi:hypothetical protein